MKIFKNKLSLQKEISKDNCLSFVPTMGGLHNGHFSLIKKAKKFNCKICVSIFVNPTQFNKKNDYKNYPRNLKSDIKELKKLKDQTHYNDDDGSDKKIAIFLDTETTGTDLAKDEIIELGMVAFEFNSETGKIFKILETFNELEEPTIEISKEASEVNGITMEMVKGHKIKDNEVKDFISSAAIILAHNAKFDRHFVEKRFSFFENTSWGCSIKDVSWHENGLKSRSLEFLAYKYG